MSNVSEREIRHRPGLQPAPEERMITTVSVGVEQLTKLKRMAAREDATQSQLIRRAINRLLQESGL